MEDKILNVIKYIIELLIGSFEFSKYIYYGSYESSSDDAKIVIIPSGFFDESVLYSVKSLPELPFDNIDNTNIPFLFGKKKCGV